MTLLDSPAAVRNKEAIWSHLSPLLGDDAHVLEIASGTGEHGVYFSSQRADIHWHSSDMAERYKASVEARRQMANQDNLYPVTHVDVTDESWALDFQPDAIYCANMLHISPPETLPGLMRGAAAHLKTGGTLFIYGPFKTQYGHTSPSNEAFDESLKARDPSWGIRALDDVVCTALDHGLVHQKTHLMPANNLSLVFKKA